MVQTLSPGPQRSTVSPAVAQHPKLSLGPIAETEITLLHEEGECKSKFVFPSLPPLPEDATSIQP